MKTGNKLLIIGFLALIVGSLNACPVCERNQPKYLKGVVHGAGPENNWDYLIMWAVIAIVLLTLIYSVKLLFKPKELEPSHIKQAILNF